MDFQLPSHRSWLSFRSSTACSRASIYGLWRDGGSLFSLRAEVSSYRLSPLHLAKPIGQELCLLRIATPSLRQSGSSATLTHYVASACQNSCQERQSISFCPSWLYPAPPCSVAHLASLDWIECHRQGFQGQELRHRAVCFGYWL